MGISQAEKPISNAKKMAVFSSQIDNFYEYSIRKMGLTDEQINNQSIEELQISLSVIEDALLKADSFGKCRLKFSAEVPIPFIAKAESDSNFETGITPLLLQAKIKVMSRLKILGADTQENEKHILRQQNIKYRNLWLVTLGIFLWVIGALSIWLIPIFIKLTIITSHKNYIPLSIMSCLIFAGLIWATLDRNITRRYFAIGSIVIAGLMGGISLI